MLYEVITPAGQGIKILKLFHLLETRERITVGLNLPSAALGAKDLIKVVITSYSIHYTKLYDRGYRWRYSGA